MKTRTLGLALASAAALALIATGMVANGQVVGANVVATQVKAPDRAENFRLVDQNSRAHLLDGAACRHDVDRERREVFGEEANQRVRLVAGEGAVLDARFADSARLRRETLRDDSTHAELRDRGLTQAARFTWHGYAAANAAAYQAACG